MILLRILFQYFVSVFLCLGCKYEFDLGALNDWLRFIYTICGLISVVFLVLTLFFYATLPELNTFHGKIGNLIKLARPGPNVIKLFTAVSYEFW